LNACMPSASVALVPRLKADDKHRGRQDPMSDTYRAIQVTKPGEFTSVRKPLVSPAPGQVRIRVEACGVCHSDSGTVEGTFPIDWPRFPGHEVVGRIDALGAGVQGWSIGQRVGVGFLGGSCGYCDFCRTGDLVNCLNQGFTGLRWRVRRGDARKVERARAHSRRSFICRCRTSAVCWTHDFQRFA